MSRFTIRDLLLVMVIVGLVIAWAIDHWRLAVAQDRLDTIIAELVSRDFEVEFENDGLWINAPPSCSGGSRSP